MHPGDMAAQMAQALDNLTAVLAGAGLELRHLVRLGVHVTDMDAALADWGVIAARLGRAGAVPAMTLVGTTRLADPAALIEIEGMAVA
jgi:enamine deaminase RidA (YjgF/YER057c/UK114 family)